MIAILIDCEKVSCNATSPTKSDRECFAFGQPALTRGKLRPIVECEWVSQEHNRNCLGCQPARTQFNR